MTNSTVSEADRKTINRANELLSEAYRTLPEYAIKQGNKDVITKEAVDKVQSFYEQVEGMRIRKKSKQGPVRLHWQLQRIGGRLKAARELISYPHERQLSKKE